LKDHLAKKGVHKLGKCDPEYDPVPGTFEYHIWEVERRFWNKRFPVYAQWKKDWYNAYLEKGYFLTHTGFKIGGDFRRNQVINYPVQGSAFHCLLMSIILVNKELAKYKMKSKLCIQIHDSMTGDVPNDEVQDFLDITNEVMTKKVPAMWDWINIPLDAEAEVTPAGGSWADKKVWEKNDSGLWVPTA
jgi:DNA polymerase I-like protein with 3'-5' exonuclease and polymerase domains